MRQLLLGMLTGMILLFLVPWSQGEAGSFVSPLGETGADPGEMTFTASVEYPLPDEAASLHQGQYFWVDGTVTASGPLDAVWARIVDEAGENVQEAAKTFAPEEDVRTYSLLDPTFAPDVSCISEELRFQDLPVGRYALRILAAEEGGEEQLLAQSAFQVNDDVWLQLHPNDLRGSYTTALAFFGTPERFMFRYKLREGSIRIDVDPQWLRQYRTKVTWLKGEKKYCHVDAKPYFKAARRYLEGTYLHISGQDFDTGAVRLSALQATLNGTMVCRFVSSGLFLSHHSLGAAIDINAFFDSHQNRLENRERIYTEVTKNLTYNGIVTVQGKPCYDFTYTGSAPREVKNVPEPLMNYLLYELAFYRAGFSWGFYYPHTCDAMHFTLTELSPELFTDGPYAMRKVFHYIEDGAAPQETT